MSRKTDIVVAVVILVVLAVLLALSRPWVGGGSGPAPTVAPPSAASGTVTATGTPSSGVATVRLSSLDGTLHVYDGEVLTRELWTKMRDYNAGDPAIAPYIEWLREALAPEPRKALDVPWYPRYRYWWFNDREGWSAETPGNDTIVRVGVVKLPFGAGLIVTAYQAGNHIDIVVHGTIINETEWMTAVARSFMCFRATLWGSIDRELRNFFHDYRPTAGWALWRVQLPSLGTYLEVRGEKTRIGTVYVLLEMPAYYAIIGGKPDPEAYFERIEWVYWSVVGEPAFALAYRLALPPDYNADKLYTRIGYISPAEANLLLKELVYSVSLLNVYHPGNDVVVNKYFTPFEERVHGIGVCEDQSRASALFASNALGMATAYVEIDYSDIDASLPGHTISVIVYPSTVYRTLGEVKLPIDIDGDGLNETADVLVDTALLSTSYINRHIENVTIELPLMYVHKSVERNCYFYMGFTHATLSLPRWLKLPWLHEFEEIIKKYEEDTMEQAVSWWHRKAWSGTWTQNVTELVAEMEKYDNPTHRFTMTAPPDFWETVALTIINKTMTAKDFVPPSVALALGKTLDNMQVVYEAHTPKLREILPAEVFEWKPIARASPPANTEPSVNTGQTRRQVTPTVNASIVLEPVYRVDWFPGVGGVLVFDHYAGWTVVNGTNVTVTAYDPEWDGRYTVTVYVNGTEAYTRGYVAPPATLSFTYRGVRYTVTLVLPEPPRLDETLTPGLEPFDTIPVPLPNGTVVNVTVYSINETVRIGNATIVIVGDASRLGVHLDVMVYGVPPGNYNAIATLVFPDGTDAPVDVDTRYTGHLYLRLYYDAPEDGQCNIQLLPEDTVLRITIQPLGLAVEVPIKG